VVLISITVEEKVSFQMHHRLKTHFATTLLFGTGPEGFEPPTTWLKAKRSA
jgi:hypothetical protein